MWPTLDGGNSRRRPCVDHPPPPTGDALVVRRCPDRSVTRPTGSSSSGTPRSPASTRRPSGRSSSRCTSVSTRSTGDSSRPTAPGTTPLVLVVTRDLVRPEDTVPLLRLAGGTKPGRVDRNHAEGDLAGYHPLAGPRRARRAGLPAARRRARRGVLRRPARGRAAGDPRAGPDAAHHRRGHRRGHPRAAAPREEQVLHALRLAPSRPAGAGAVDQRTRAEARLVLGRQPAHLARGRVRGGPGRGPESARALGDALALGLVHGRLVRRHQARDRQRLQPLDDLAAAAPGEAPDSL